MLSRKIYRCCTCLLSKCPQNLIIIVENYKIILSLLCCYALLNSRIILHRVMPVKMVRCYVKNGAHLRSELMHRLKLEAGNLSNSH